MAAKEEGKDHPMQPDSKKRKRDDDHGQPGQQLRARAVLGLRGQHQPETEPQPGERKHRRESTSKKSQGAEGIDSQTAGEIAGLLRHMTEQQGQIIAQQKQILEIRAQHLSAVEQRSLSGAQRTQAGQGMDAGRSSWMRLAGEVQ
ncbi:hypothetical protein GUITHDRAFT_117465 [Guillardia theta CCMP2712]|uniref:Uncharacterized protein n=1 Tax=Guillardia theta (strain CCMP2712) TaxID=905079 RepID=L1IJF4_GUITC|nr:hypothetical protein GUITHDRAFT_117465 [Guillardia theta CCMP2712]EKX36356.1 hypothetical protein GUITHDRAFT_117465 [Guillardia theta CCMP2712]|eukprot:XP_005823336.1 hypothetical protein GUITHDRAFT_117465 [Guillardia theta CCMP2712]